MKTVYLLPPSEGKNFHPIDSSLECQPPNPLPCKEGEKLHFRFEKPCGIAMNASEKDLKCKGKRYEEGIELNKRLCNPPPNPLPCKEGEGIFVHAIERYSGVMFSAIGYSGMSDSGKQFFEENFLILSGMYGILKPLDCIGNYKLPIETKGLYDFWGTQIIEALNNAGVTKVVNLLPESYAKLIYGKNKTQQKIFAELREFEIEDKIFYQPHPNPLLSGEGTALKKMTHGVKKVKGEWIKELCENS